MPNDTNTLHDANVRGPGWRSRLARELEQRPRLRRELYFAGGSLLFGFIVVPLMIYLAGSMTLGSYASGGPGSFLGDFFLGLIRGWPAAWAAALGPYALIIVLRLTGFVMRRFLAGEAR